MGYQRKLILIRKGQGRYAPDEYQLNLIQEEFQRMRQQGKAGYQPLTLSEVDILLASLPTSRATSRPIMARHAAPASQTSQAS